MQQNINQSETKISDKSTETVPFHKISRPGN